MAKTYTVDASVFLNAFNPYERGHEASNGLLAHLQQHALPIIVPTLLLPEVAAAVSRGRQDEALARDFALGLTRLPHLVMVPLDETLARQALDVAASHRLRGSDAVYVAVSLRFGSILVTLDHEQQERLAAFTAACQPVKALDDLQ